ncbi:hypothetical protein Ppa06_26300 [Planomonospora parontospora subsp. parontospora]|uniref:Uncharacterized protein n=2 Tax=Planomonospora parontospora TaxID=58119 RepID=A0AA37BEG7_9ACTN|nr:hypothetical protein [Planomonospora parontospora]GGK59971.1 hypothetical protein GCM10010126_19380 [Planomonospora parontospora]GII08832.1 hypothetical protein Ppa06_26300 [Planomonospora parontospora subsp. parontospora]
MDGDAPQSYDLAADGFDLPAVDSTTPLPPIRQDPAIAAGLAAADTYPAQIEAIRDDHTLSDLEKTEKLAQVHAEQEARMQALVENLYGRRRARLALLQQEIPTGPGIPSDASAADRAVLNTAFRAALEQARAADFDQRKAMLADAVRFDDEPTLRALLTAAGENGDNQLLDAWAGATGKTDVVTEIRRLNAQLNGNHDGLLWEAKALRMPQRPPEVTRLLELRQKAAQEEAEREREREERLARRLGVPVHAVRRQKAAERNAS